jgi:hypothetical protein
MDDLFLKKWQDASILLACAGAVPGPDNIIGRHMMLDICTIVLLILLLLLTSPRSQKCE